MPSPPAALEAALADNPDDLAAHAAYADVLAEESDPRGEFIHVQLALEQPGRSGDERKRLQRREQALWKAHGRKWLGEVGKHLPEPAGTGRGKKKEQDRRYEFTRGWLTTLDVDKLTLDLVQALVRTPAARLLQRLVVRESISLSPDEELGDSLAGLRAFQLGEDDRSYRGQSNGQLPERFASTSRLEELHLYSWDMDIEALFEFRTLTNLRVLHAEGMSATPLSILAGNRFLRRLEELWLHPSDLGGVDPIPSEEVDEFARSKNLPNLVTLRLHLYDDGDAVCQAIARSGILRRLKTLELNYGDVTDAGARGLARSKDIKHLERLNLSYNQLTEDGIAALRATGVPLVADEQLPPGTRGDEYEEDWE